MSTTYANLLEEGITDIGGGSDGFVGHGFVGAVVVLV